MSIRLEGAALVVLGVAVVVNSAPLFFVGCCLLLLRWGARLWLRTISRGLTVRRGGDEHVRLPAVDQVRRD